MGHVLQTVYSRVEILRPTDSQEEHKMRIKMHYIGLYN